MSSEGPKSIPRLPPEWDRLELAVRRLLDDRDRWQSRARAAERRVRELEGLLNEMSEEGVDPIALARRLEAVEAENRALRERIDDAKARVEKILARLRFLEGE